MWPVIVNELHALWRLSNRRIAPNFPTLIHTTLSSTFRITRIVRLFTTSVAPIVKLQAPLSVRDIQQLPPGVVHARPHQNKGE